VGEETKTTSTWILKIHALFSHLTNYGSSFILVPVMDLNFKNIFPSPSPSHCFHCFNLCRIFFPLDATHTGGKKGKTLFSFFSWITRNVNSRFHLDKKWENIISSATAPPRSTADARGSPKPQMFKLWWNRTHANSIVFYCFKIPHMRWEKRKLFFVHESNYIIDSRTLSHLDKRNKTFLTFSTWLTSNLSTNLSLCLHNHSHANCVEFISLKMAKKRFAFFFFVNEPIDF